MLLAFLIGCTLQVYNNVLYNHPDWIDEGGVLFLENDDWSMDNTSQASNCLWMTYWAFTTLSSVGFGDYYPKNTEERLLMIIIFLFSLTVFSAILGYMQDLLVHSDKLDAENGDRN